MPLRVLSFLVALLAAAVFAGPAYAGRCSETDSCHADLSVSGHAEPQPIKVGEASEYKFEVNNNGPDPALAVKFQVNVPDGLQITGTEVYGGQSCSTSGQFVECQMGDYANFQKGVVKVKVKGVKAGTYLAEGKVFGYDILEPSGGNNQVTATLQVLSTGSSTGTSTGTSGGTGTSSGSGSTTSGGTSSSGNASSALQLKAKDMQRVLKTGGITITVVTQKTGTLRLRGSVRSATGATIPLVSVARGVRAGETVSVFLGTTSAAKTRLRKAFRGHGYLEANFLVTIGVAKAKLQTHVRI